MLAIEMAEGLGTASRIRHKTSHHSRTDGNLISKGGHVGIIEPMWVQDHGIGATTLVESDLTGPRERQASGKHVLKRQSWRQRARPIRKGGSRKALTGPDLQGIALWKKQRPRRRHKPTICQTAQNLGAGDGQALLVRSRLNDFLARLIAACIDKRNPSS